MSWRGSLLLDRNLNELNWSSVIWVMFRYIIVLIVSSWKSWFKTMTSRQNF